MSDDDYRGLDRGATVGFFLKMVSASLGEFSTSRMSRRLKKNSIVHQQSICSFNLQEVGRLPARIPQLT